MRIRVHRSQRKELQMSLMLLKAKGASMHHFWGNYYMTIGLKFQSEWHAKVALESGKLHSAFEIGKGDPAVLGCTVDSDTLKEIKETLKPFTTPNVDAIDSVLHSVDYGDPFDVEFEVVDPRQQELFNA